MSVTAAEVIDRARRIILDETSVRWPLPELLLWTDDGQREIALHKPTATAESIVLGLVEGTLQTLPPAYQSLLRITRNIVAAPEGETRQPGRAIRIVPRDQLDALNPRWHEAGAVPFATEARHYVYDEASPREFFVYPGNDGTGKVEATLSRIPARLAIADGADADDLASYALELDVSRIYLTALVDYVLYRAYSKDAQFSGNAQRAGAYYGQFAAAVGIKGQAEAVTTPNGARSVPTA